MKRYRIFIFLSLIICCACSDWLNVSSQQEKKEEDLFKSEEGFKIVLTGCYIKLADYNGYGMLGTNAIPEMIVQHWNIPTNPSYGTPLLYYMGMHDYTHQEVESAISNYWQNQYNVIAQLNSLLEDIDGKEDLFKNGNYELIKGEALGLRAFIHFDLLRLFGPIPLTAQNSSVTIPYIENTTLNPNELLSLPYQEVLSKIIDDLDEAENFLKDDPLREYKVNVLNQVSGVSTDEDKPVDSWQWYRNTRFNYYAVLATKARYYLWIGNKIEAAKYAKIVADELDSNGEYKFKLVDEEYYTTVATKELQFRQEQIFGLQNSRYSSYNTNYFNISGNTWFYSSQTNIGRVYENYADDVRFKSGENRYWVQNTSSGTRYNFLFFGGNSSFSYYHQFPIIKVSEMYLILSECLTDLTEAQEYFERYAIARNIATGTINDIMNENKDLRIETEYRKEFFGQGQMLYYYKRLNYNNFSYPTTIPVGEDIYVLPKPEGQLIFE